MPSSNALPENSKPLLTDRDHFAAAANEARREGQASRADELSAPMTPTSWTFRDVLPKLRGRTITGYATIAAGDHLQALTITLDDGSRIDLTASAYNSFIDVEMGP